jgi:hypothetical protein
MGPVMPVRYLVYLAIGATVVGKEALVTQTQLILGREPESMHAWQLRTATHAPSLTVHSYPRTAAGG